MTPIERAARALHHFNMKGQHPKPENYPWEALNQREQALLRARAHAVVAAIREPSEEMVRATDKVEVGVWPHDSGLSDDEAKTVWSMMIDALLDETP